MGLSHLLKGCTMAEKQNVEPDLILRNGRIALYRRHGRQAACSRSRRGKALAIRADADAPYS
jgi:hypothetical protein